MKNYIFLSIIIFYFSILVQCKLLSEIEEETRQSLKNDTREIFDENRKKIKVINKLERKILGLNSMHDESMKERKLKKGLKISNQLKRNKEINENEENDLDFVIDNPMFNPLFFQGDILLTNTQLKNIIKDLREQINDMKNNETELTTTPETPLTTSQENFTTTISPEEVEVTMEESTLSIETTTEFYISPDKNELNVSKEEETNNDNGYFKDNLDEIIRKRRDTNNTITFKWKLPISYYIDPSLNVENVEKAIKLFHLNTCIRFIKEENYITDREGINFYPGFGCWSFLGLVNENTSQQVSLGKDCDTNVFIIQHQIAHTLGLPHQESNSKRDYVNTIEKSNIITSLEGNLAISNYLNTFKNQSDYDFGSSMHFDDTKVSRNSQKVIVPNVIEYNRMKTFNRTLNFNDYKELNYYYCNDSCPNKIDNCKNDGYQDPNSCFNCKCTNTFEGKYCEKLVNSIGICGKSNLVARNVRQALVGRGNGKCIYEIKSDSFLRINITLTELNIEDTQPCLEEAGLVIKYQSDKGISGLCLCGNHKNISITSEDNSVVIHFFGTKLTDYFRLVYEEISQ